MTALREFHRYADHSQIRWRCDSVGLEIEGEGFQRTPGPPATIARIWENWSDHLQGFAWTLGVPVELLLATVATESSASLDPRQDRKEPGYVSDEATPNRVSIGICHLLIATARGVTGFAVGRAWLQVPRNNIFAAGLVIKDDARATRLDPVYMLAQYNAGGLRGSTKNRWGLRSYGNHLDRGVRFFGDAVAFIADKGGCER